MYFICRNVQYSIFFLYVILLSGLFELTFGRAFPQDALSTFDFLNDSRNSMLGRSDLDQEAELPSERKPAVTQHTTETRFALRL